MAHTVYCTATADQTQVIMRNLQTAGFPSGDISVLLAEPRDTQKFALENNTKAPEGAATGAGAGALLGGTLGWLVGIGSLAIPGVGPFIAAGPIMAALGGAALGGTVGGLTGALIGMGVPEYEAKQYEDRVKSGSSLISVHTYNDVETARVKTIFTDAGAADVTTTNVAGYSSLA